MHVYSDDNGHLLVNVDVHHGTIKFDELLLRFSRILKLNVVVLLETKLSLLIEIHSVQNQ